MKAEDYLSLDRGKQMQLEESFGFLRDIKVDNIGGQDFMTKDGVPLNAVSKMTEAEFVKDWIIQFALNNSTSENNYFNFIEWGKRSNQHTMAVLIVKDDNPSETIFVVKPLSSYEMSPMERDIMRQASSALQSSLQAKHEGQVPELDPNKIVEKTKEYFADVGNTQIHELVPIEFYHKHKVYPQALRQVIYIRDELFKGQISQEVLFKLKEIFEKEEIEGCATREEYEYVKSVCGEQYIIPEDLLAAHGQKKAAIKINEEDNNTGDDLFSC